MWLTFQKIMGYNLKNSRNGKSMSKITKWPSLRPLALKNEIFLYGSLNV